MPRPHRLRAAGATYHVTARGNRRQDIFREAEDYLRFLSLLDDLAERRGWRGYGYCLLSNHYHLVFETPKPDLSEGMQWLNGRFAQAFNHRHGQDGHLFQGRFHSVPVERLAPARALALPGVESRQGRPLPASKTLALGQLCGSCRP
jgi:putative transposase